MKCSMTEPRVLARSMWLTPALCIVLAACTTWIKPGADEASLDAATTHCKAVSYSQMPARPTTTTSRGASYSERKKCEKNSLNGCSKIDGRYYENVSITTDTNSSGRDAIFRDCMYQGGWREE